MTDLSVPARRNADGSAGTERQTPKLVRVAIVDDHPLVLVGLRAVVTANPDFEVAAEASEADAALALIKAVSPHVAVVDVPMPGLTVVDFVRFCRELRPKSKVIAITRCADSTILAELLQSGAHGYLLKHSVPADLARAIRMVLSGNAYVDPAIASKLLVRTNPDDTIAPTTLSQREFAVLKLVARGFGSKEMAAELKLSIKTVQTYKKRAMKKLHLRTRADIVRYGVTRGWMDEV